MPQQFIQAVPLADIAESPFNPRKLFHGPAMAELAESIREQGVLSPVLLRPLSGLAADNVLASYELVFGHRRFRAAKLAGLTEIPALIQEMDDAEALQKQLVENARRADMTPIEESEGYLALHRKHGMPVTEIALKVGKDPSHIYQRMQLGNLPEQAAHAVASGDMALSVGLALARMPNAELRTKAAEEVLELTTRQTWDHDAQDYVEVRERMSTDAALRHIRNRYSLRLAGCPWTDDSNLPGGACSKCPKRSSNMGNLFPELADKHDLCLDPDCFARKREAAWKRRKADLEAQGRKVFDGKEAEKIVGEFGPRLSSGYASADTPCSEDPKGRTWAQLLGKAAAKLPIARDATGKEHVIVTPEIIATKKAEIGKKIGKPAQESEDDEAADFEGDVKHLAAELTVAKCVEAAEAVDADEARIWKTCAELLLCEGGYRAEPLHTAKRRGLYDHEKSDNRLEVFQNLRQWLRTVATPAQIRGLVLELLMEEEGRCFDIWGGGGPECLSQVAQDLAVATKPLALKARRKVTAERKAAEKAKAEKKSGKKLKASDFELGEVVTYREGRGRFKAKVMKVETDTGLLCLTRESDGKMVERPAVKVEKGWAA